MNLARSPAQYDTTDQDRMRGEIAKADGQNIKRTEALDRLLFKSPDGHLFYLSVSNAGATVWTAA